MPSQYGEDARVLELFAGRTGRFLDLGAYDWQALSNTRALADAGWTGVLVEGGPHQVDALLRQTQNEPRVRLINAIVHPRSTGLIVPFWSSDDAISSTRAAHVREWKTCVLDYAPMEVVTLSITDLMRHLNERFDFISIDVEGESAEVALALIQTVPQWLPEVMCVEHDGQAVTLLAQATPHGYQEVWQNGTNLILRRTP
jgi:FkbM family methyltransferase